MKIEENDRAVIIRLEDDVLLEQADQFASTVEDALGRGKQCLIIDFEGIDFLASQCLKTIATTVQALREDGGELVILRPTERIRQLCRITKLDWVVKIIDHESDCGNCGKVDS